MYEIIEQFYEENHDILISKDGSLRPAKSVPKEAAPAIEKFKEYRIHTDRMSFPHDELGPILGELEVNTVTQNVRIMKEFGFITETSNANNQKEYNFTSSFVDFVSSSEDTRSYILDRLHAISSLADFNMYFNFLLCVLREAATEGRIIAYPNAKKQFIDKVEDDEKRKSHRERVYRIYGFQSRGKHWDHDEYTPNISYYCQAELKELGLITKKNAEPVDGMDTLTLTPSGHYLLKKISDNIRNQYKKRNNVNTNDLHEPLNTILYGPPGTGKTYNTITEALAIIQNKTYVEVKLLDRKMVKKDFESLSKKKQIMFTTFHQSMSYEDFVEGIKPVIIDDDVKGNQEISYEIAGGIFKQAAARAAYNSYKEFHVKNSTGYNFGELYESFIEMARVKIAANNLFTCETKTGNFVEIFRINKNNSIQARAEGSKATHVAPLTRENIQKLYDTYETVNEINHLQQVRDVVGVTPRSTEFFAVFKALLNFEKNDFEPNNENEELKEVELTDEEILLQFDSGVFTEMSRKFGKISSRVVLIIDEINRGNVSAIFGELITLLEEDKRLGEENEIVITLPYSKRQFSVPSNLYIIGTMNTADRSVEALDTALRRRFSFVEMMPDVSLLESKEIDAINLKDVLSTINDRIEILIDRDHTIGHSYFMNINNSKELKLAFKDKIVPLLQEYFYGDYGKIGLVLGEGFVKSHSKSKNPFAGFKYEGKEELNRDFYDLVPIDDTFDITNALENLLNNPKDNQD